MRLSEFTHNLTNLRRLDEVNMRPSSLRSLASNINARAGMEFELGIPETSESHVISQSFAEAIGKPVSDSSEYHDDNIKRPDHENNFYLIEPDGSIELDGNGVEFISLIPNGLEFVSPAMPVAEMISDLDKVVKWAINTGCFTNKSTGLHINISVDNWSSQKGQLDYVKLVLLSGDQHILEEFNRQGNDYCASALKKINNLSSRKFLDLFREIKSGLNGLAQDILELGKIEKYTSIHPKDGYVEFRAPGGDWLGIYQSNPGKIINTMLRYVVALDAAVDPEKYREDYLKKLYAMTKPKSNNDPLAYFAQYAAGEIDFDQLAHNASVIRSRRKTKLVGDILNLTGIISPNLTGKVSPDLEGDVSNITGDVSNIEGDASNIEGDVSNIQGNVRNIKGDVSNITGDVSNIWGNVKNIRGDVSNIQNSVSNITGDVSNLKGSVYYLKGDVSNIKGDASYLHGNVSNIEGDVSNIDGNVEKLEGNVSKLEGDVSCISGKVAGCYGDVSKISGNIRNITGNVSNIRGYASLIKGDVSNIKGVVNNLKGDVSNIQGDVSNIRGDVSNLTGDVSNIEWHVDNIRGDVSNIKGDVSDLTGDATGCEGDVTGLRGDIRAALNARS